MNGDLILQYFITVIRTKTERLGNIKQRGALSQSLFIYEKINKLVKAQGTPLQYTLSVKQVHNTSIM